MPMTEEEVKKAYQDWIDDYVGYEIDWTNPPGAAAIALESLIENHEPTEDKVVSESIDDMSKTYESRQDFYNNVMKPLHSIRKMKW